MIAVGGVEWATRVYGPRVSRTREGRGVETASRPTGIAPIRGNAENCLAVAQQHSLLGNSKRGILVRHRTQVGGHLPVGQRVEEGAAL